MTTTTWVAVGAMAMFLVLYLMRRKARLDQDND